MKGASNPAKEGLAMAVAMAAQLKSVPGVRGIHILCGGCEELAGQIIQAAGLA
jgi:bacterioferritin-associated ferredoxin